jgi:oxaloacetate decarboxylase beta subunit
MKNKIYLLFTFLFLAIVSFAGNADIKAELIKGKWMNKSGGYYPSPVMPKGDKKMETVERWKTIVFHDDGTFSMDSAKHEYLGEYIIDSGYVHLYFFPSLVQHYDKNMSKASGGYIVTEDTVELPMRKGVLKGDKLIIENGSEYTRHSSSMHGLLKFWEFSGFANATWGHFIMLLVGLVFVFLAIRFNYEPLLLVPIGIGIIIGNTPMFQAVDFNLQLGIYEPGSVMNFFYSGVVNGWFPPLIFLGIGAMTDFSALISNPRLMLLGAAAQFGVFATFILALIVGFYPAEAGAIGIIGGADGPTAIFLSSKLANGLNIVGFDAVGAPIFSKNLLGAIAIAAYSYMALVPVIQPPVVNLLTTKKERLIKMRPPRQVSKTEKILFPIIGLLLTSYISPTSLPLLGMLFLGNILKESGVTRRLAETAANPLIDTITILLGVSVGASTQADVFLTYDSVMIFTMGALSFVLATAFGVFFAKIMNWLSPKSNPVNPIIGCAGVSAVPDSARVAQEIGHKADPSNYLLMHAMGPNVAGVIGSAIAAGILLSFLL